MAEPHHALDLERVTAAAAERGCFLELNAQPSRLDLDDLHCRLAKDFPFVLRSCGLIANARQHEPVAGDDNLGSLDTCPASTAKVSGSARSDSYPASVSRSVRMQP